MPFIKLTPIILFTYTDVGHMTYNFLTVVL